MPDLDFAQMIDEATAFVDQFVHSEDGQKKMASTGAKFVNWVKGKKNQSDAWATPNIHMVQNGHCEKDAGEKASPTCKAYFKSRSYKKLGGAAVSKAGGAAGIFTANVNVGGALRHSRSLGKTIAHLHNLSKQAALIKQSKYLTRLMNVILIMKVIKAGNQGGQLACDLCPIPAVDQVISMVTTSVTGASKLTMSKAVTWASVELHWRAYVEQKLAGPKGSGPAMRMVHELFHQAAFAFPWQSGPETVTKYIREPAGWMVIKDKLNLI
jgi:hypothetical protein